MSGFVQHFLSLSRHLLLAVMILAAWPFLRERPEFSNLPDALVQVDLDAVSQASPAGWTLYGAWTLSAEDPRLAGLSGLACPSFGTLDMVTDTGSSVNMRYPAPGMRRMTALIAGLDGIGDAEAIGYFGNATFVAEEVRHRLWVLRPGLDPLALPLPAREGFENWGIEALLEPGGESERMVGLLELGTLAYRFAERDVEVLPVEGAPMRVTGATRHPDGRGLVLLRKLGPVGFTAALARIVVESDRVLIGEAVRLPMPFNANAEGICVEPREDGLTRLWIVTDDNGLGLLSQRLVAWDMPDAAWPKAP